MTITFEYSWPALQGFKAFLEHSPSFSSTSLALTPPSSLWQHVSCRPASSAISFQPFHYPCPHSRQVSPATSRHLFIALYEPLTSILQGPTLLLSPFPKHHRLRLALSHSQIACKHSL